jgi:hypothetical protein
MPNNFRICAVMIPACSGKFHSTKVSMVVMQIAEPTLLRVRADGEVHAEDVARLAPRLGELARHQSEPIPVLVELGPQLRLQQLRALWQSVRIEAHHRRLLGAVAVVGEPGWAFPTHLASALHPEPVRFFERGDEAQAETWLRQCADGSARAGDRSAEA